jgi:FkbM family methyltransferase
MKELAHIELGSVQEESVLALASGERLPGPVDLDVRTVFDIGSCSGEYTAPASTNYPNAIIHAFEPVKVARDIFCDWLSKMNFSDRVVLYPHVLSDCDSDQKFDTMLADVTCSSLLHPTRWLRGRHHALSEESIDTELCTVRTLDSIVDEFKIALNKDVVLKIDVQGAEDRVLRGAIKTLTQVRMIQLELCYDLFYEGQATLKSIIDILDPLGFRFGGTSAQAGNPYSGGILYGDLLFIHPGSRK